MLAGGSGAVWVQGIVGLGVAGKDRPKTRGRPVRGCSAMEGVVESAVLVLSDRLRERGCLGVGRGGG